MNTKSDTQDAATEKEILGAFLDNMLAHHTGQLVTALSDGNHPAAALATGIVTFCKEGVNYLSECEDETLDELPELLDMLTLENLAAIKMVREWQFREKSDADDARIAMMAGTAGDHLLLGYKQLKNASSEAAFLVAIAAIASLFVGRVLAATYLHNVMSSHNDVVSFEEWCDTFKTSGVTHTIFDRTFTIHGDGTVSEMAV